MTPHISIPQYVCAAVELCEPPTFHFTEFAVIPK